MMRVRASLRPERAWVLWNGEISSTYAVHRAFNRTLSSLMSVPSQYTGAAAVLRLLNSSHFSNRAHFVDFVWEEK